jgi:putative sigma-54 modulation protein
MQLDLITKGIALTRHLRDHAERRARHSFGRIDAAISRIQLRLADENGPKGGRDVACRASLHFAHGGAVHVAGTWLDPVQAIDAGLSRLRAAAQHRRDRQADRRS